MSETLATTIICIGMSVGGLVWLAALRSLRSIAATPAEVVREITMPIPGSLAQDAVLRAALQSRLPFAAGVHVIEDVPGRLGFQLTGGTLVTFDLVEAFGGTTIEVVMDVSKAKTTYRGVMALLVTAVMPLVVLGIGWVLLSFVANSPQLALRWQAVQILQIAHVLWPPFLVSKLFQSRVQLAEGFVDNVVAAAKIGDNVSAV